MKTENGSKTELTLFDIQKLELTMLKKFQEVREWTHGLSDRDKKKLAVDIIKIEKRSLSMSRQIGRYSYQVEKMLRKLK